VREPPDLRTDSRLSNIQWEPRAQSFVESLRAVLAPPPAGFDPAAAPSGSWRSSFIEGRIPRGSIAASAAWHIFMAALILLPLGHPLEARAPHTRASYEHTVLYAPRDLQSIAPRGQSPLAAPQRPELRRSRNVGPIPARRSFAPTLHSRRPKSARRSLTSRNGQARLRSRRRSSNLLPQRSRSNAG